MAKKDQRLSHLHQAARPPALLTASLARLETAMGGRYALVTALSHAPKAKDLDFLLGLIGDPQYEDTPLATLAAIGGITAGELLDHYKAGVLARAQALATKAVGERLPDVVADTMKLAAPHEDDCRACQGLGQVVPDPTAEAPNPTPVACPICGGHGRLRYDGDLEHKKLALEMGRLLTKGGGVQITQSMTQQAHTVVGALAGGTLERLQAATDQILYGHTEAPILEGETVPVHVGDPPVGSAAPEDH